MLRILLVEDEFVLSLATSMLLEDEGYKVTYAYSGDEGLAKLLAEPPDLLITDYMMPVMDGLTLITRLRALGWSGPIILTTAIPEEKFPTEYVPMHDAYLSKPFLGTDLLRTVERVLADKRAPHPQDNVPSPNTPDKPSPDKK